MPCVLLSCGCRFCFVLNINKTSYIFFVFLEIMITIKILYSVTVKQECTNSQPMRTKRLLGGLSDITKLSFLSQKNTTKGPTTQGISKHWKRTKGKLLSYKSHLIYSFHSRKFFQRWTSKDSRSRDPISWRFSYLTWNNAFHKIRWRYQDIAKARVTVQHGEQGLFGKTLVKTERLVRKYWTRIAR